jgi:bifunctional DNA-binding transcriptional regulator/antitoxin component of YhaV-PrlF toxin-antitoxin module
MCVYIRGRTICRVKMSESESVVGSKEELYPPKSVRRALNLKPGTKVRYRVEGTRLIVEPIPSVDELAERKPTVTISLKELHRDRRRLSAALEK